MTNKHETATNQALVETMKDEIQRALKEKHEKTKQQATVFLTGLDEVHLGKSAFALMTLKNDNFICVVQEERKELFEANLKLLEKKRDEIDQIASEVFLRALFGTTKTTAEIIKDENDQERKVFRHSFVNISNAVLDVSDGAVLIRAETEEEQIEKLREALAEDKEARLPQLLADQSVCKSCQEAEAHKPNCKEGEKQ